MPIERYVLSHHARDAMAKRGIARAWLEHALSTPDRVESDATDGALEHHLCAITENGGRVLRVIVNIRVAPVRVVTVYFDRKEQRRQ